MLVNPTDTEKIRFGMLKIAEDSKLRNSLSEKGILRANCFCWEKTAKQTLKVYKGILNEKALV